MKKYKKHPSKLFQVRLSETEYEEVIAEIKKTGLTRRAYILEVIKK